VVTLLLPPRSGFKAHNLTMTVNTVPAAIFNQRFNGTQKEIGLRVFSEGNFNVTAFESNYQARIQTAIFVEPSNTLFS
jgi:hypothetical protein